jgi:hypothetical protein
VIKIISDLLQVDGFSTPSGYSNFLHQQNWPQRYSCNIVESGVKHHIQKYSCALPIYHLSKIWFSPSHLVLKRSLYSERIWKHSWNFVVGFTATYAIRTYYHNRCCEFEYHKGRLAQQYVIKIISDLLQVGGFSTPSGYSNFLHQQNWPQRYSCNIVESGAKHHITNQDMQAPSLFQLLIFWTNLKTFMEFCRNKFCGKPQTVLVSTPILPSGMGYIGE